MAEPTSPAEEVDSDHSDEDDIESVSSSLLAVASSDPVISPRASSAPQSSQPPRSSIDEIERLLLDHEPEHQDTNVQLMVHHLELHIEGHLETFQCKIEAAEVQSTLLQVKIDELTTEKNRTQQRIASLLDTIVRIQFAAMMVYCVHPTDTPQMSAYSSLSSSPAIADVESKQQLFCSMVHGQLPWTQWWDSFLGSRPPELVSCESVVSNEFFEVTKKAIEHTFHAIVKAQQEAAACLERQTEFDRELEELMMDREDLISLCGTEQGKVLDLEREHDADLENLHSLHRLVADIKEENSALKSELEELQARHKEHENFSQKIRIMLA
ncbi:hypothetical protein C8J57DRAFT_1527906 [Mycena rebaudengoi]|nr:hypothetical protein C8J57DRAFT_1527906 [Mycena rebaudengoi]